MSEAEIETKQEHNSTADFLSSSLRHPVCVSLHNDTQYRGTLLSVDGYMNIVLEAATELCGDVTVQTYEEVFIRGNNVMAITRI